MAAMLQLFDCSQQVLGSAVAAFVTEEMKHLHSIHSQDIRVKPVKVLQGIAHLDRLAMPQEVVKSISSITANGASPVQEVCRTMAPKLPKLIGQ
jgi:hypothetical protein